MWHQSTGFKLYTGEPFTVSNKKLFCSACREELATKKSAIELHLKSIKHSRGKKILSSNTQREQDIIQALKTMDRESHPEGERLPTSVRLYQIKVVHTVLRQRSYSPTRWWSKFEVLRQLHDTFGDVLGFLESDSMPPATSNALLEILCNPLRRQES